MARMNRAHSDEGRQAVSCDGSRSAAVRALPSLRIAVVISLSACLGACADEMAAPSSTASVPAGLTCQLLSRPKVERITAATPKLGWVVPLAKRGDRQTAYQILAGSSGEL